MSFEFTQRKMSEKKGKKRKPAPLLDYLAIKASTTANRGYINEVREKISALNNVDFERLLSMSGLCDVSEDEALQLLASKLSVDGLNNLRNALRHVPKNIMRVVNGIPLRTSLIHKLFTTVTTTREHMSIEELSVCIKFMETFCAAFVGQTDSDEHLWRLTNTEDFSYKKFLTPPVSVCILCEKNLTIRNNPSKAKLFTLEGPVPCTKITLECRGCAHVYGVCNYTDQSGKHFYPHVVELVEISDVTYMDVKLYKWFPALSNHCWVSFSGFSEAYNDVYVEAIEKYASVCSNQTQPEEPEFEDNVDEGGECSKNVGVLPGELPAKALAKCFWHREVEEELATLGLRGKWVLSKEPGPLSGSYDHAMEMVDKMRSDQLYLHNCSDHCKSKGCGQLYVADGNWKLRYAHCMWKVPVSIDKFGPISYPNICPLSPKRGQAFCESHCAKAYKLGVPTGLRDLYKHCGVTGANMNSALEELSTRATLTENHESIISTCLDKICSTEQDIDDYNASTFQGTTEFLQTNPSFVGDQSLSDETSCNKDTGGLKAFHSWSRGVFVIVSAGGNIEYWQPLYRSESPTQAFLVTILWLYRKFKGMKDTHSDEDIQQAMSSICLAYDNMCHMDSLKIAKADLPLPKPFHEAWKLITKVIDRLHIRNHVDPKCHRLYNADDKVPKQFNTMACEQTFIWASRFKKVICAMPHVHHLFFLHRLVQYRNRYTEKCHRLRKTPVLPKIGKSSDN